MITNKNFTYGSLVLLYHRYVEHYHVEPIDWQDLFEFIELQSTDTKINKYLQSLSKDGK